MMRIVDAGLTAAGLALLGIAALLGRFFAEAIGVGDAWLMVAVPAALGAGCFAAHALPRDGRISVLACFAAAVAAIYLGEIALQTNLWTPGAATRQAGAAEVDRRTPREVIADLRREGKPAFPAVFPRSQFVYGRDGTGFALGDLLPLGGIAEVTTVFCNETGRYFIYESDERGFNNPRGAWDAAELDVLALGDSFTQGACIDNPKNYMGLIRTAKPRTLSLGIASNGPLLMLAGLGEYLPRMKPRVVLWFLFEENDIETDLAIERTVPLLRNYLTPGFSQRLAERQGEIDGRLKAWLGGLSGGPNAVNAPPRAGGTVGGVNLSDIVLLRGLRNALSLRLDRHPAEYALFEKILARAKAETDASGAELKLVYLPSQRRFASFFGRHLHDLQRARVRAATERLGVAMIDLVPAFARAKPETLFAGHYTEAGNAIVADEVLQAIMPAAARR